MVPTLPEVIASMPADRLAVFDGARRETYGGLHATACRVATWVSRRYGVGQCVVVKARSTVAFLAVWLGVIRSGNRVVPIDPQTPEPALRYVLEKTGSPAALEPDDVLREAESMALEVAASPDPANVAMVMLTSGTTGAPKGVIMTHANLSHSWLAVSDYLRFAEQPRTICVLPLHYSYGLISQVLCMLSVGGYVRLTEGLKNPLAFEQTVQKEEIASFCGVPSSFAMLARFNKLKPLSMPSVRVVCSAGAAFDMSLYPIMKRIFPNAEIFNNYGMTEACPRISYVSDRDPMFHQGSCGVAMRGVELVTLDPNSHQVLADGAEGVLGVRGPNIMGGYLNDERQSKKAFQRDGYLITGDLARIVDGQLFILGRVDDIFNVGGEKVAPLEIEAVLKQIPAVAEALVRGIHDPDRGQVPAAFLVLSGEIDKQSLEAHLMQHLAPAKVPSAYFAVSELPMTSNGKLKRRDISPTSPSVLRVIS